jgi:hypothetical protein
VRDSCSLGSASYAAAVLCVPIRTSLKNPCSGSVTFWDPYLCLSDQAPNLDLDPALFDSDLQDANKKNNIFPLSFYAYSLLKVNLHHSSKKKVKKKPQNSRNQGFSSYFWLFIERS